MLLFPFRWNSKCKMLQSIIDLKPALVETLSNMDVPVAFNYQDWELMKKVLNVLAPFKDATDMLSSHDASISMVIPFVTMIIDGLEDENPTEEHGVLTLKRSLKKAMKERFVNIEDNEDYTVSTLLDSKYKGDFFREDLTLTLAKEALTDKLVESLRDESTSEVNTYHNTLDLGT